MASKFEKRVADLSSHEVKIRREAARWLCANARRQDASALCSALRDADYSVRGYAARGLGSIGDPETIEPLCKALDDRTKTVVKAAISALLRFPEERAAQAITLLLQSTKQKKRAWAQEALVENGPIAAPLLCKALSNESAALQAEAAIALPLLIIHKPEKTVDVILADPRLSVGERVTGLKVLREHRTNRFFGFSFDPFRYCEKMAARAEDLSVRAGAQAVLEYMSLVRGSVSDASVKPSELLRSAYVGPDDRPSELLRGSILEHDSAPIKSLSLMARFRRFFNRDQTD